MDFSIIIYGLELPGSFCTFAKARKEIQHLCDLGANVVPIFSFNAQTCDTRFGSAREYVDGICEITGNEGINTICAAEPIGPNNFLDIMVIAPCTGNGGKAVQRDYRYAGFDGNKGAYEKRQAVSHSDFDK